MPFGIYNKSCEDMSEIKTSSIDLIVFSPPYNIGTAYSTFRDKGSETAYERMLKNALTSCHRVLRNDGRMLIEVADSIKISDKYIQLAGLVQSCSLKAGFYLSERHINFILTKDNIELPDHGWVDYATKGNAHSNCHQWLVFSKKKTQFKGGKILYFTYVPDSVHPCPFPEKAVQFIIDRYFKRGFSVLDPFMGTAGLGCEVLKRKGNFYGYDVVKDYCNTAFQRLSKIRQ